MKKQEAISWYFNHLLKNQDYISKKQIFSPLLPPYEKGILSSSTQFSYFKSFKSVLGYCIFHDEYKTGIKSDGVYFWPFQFLHCDFQLTVIKACKNQGIPFQVYVFREDLVGYLSESGIKATFVKTERKLNPIKVIINRAFTFLTSCISILLSNAPTTWKKSVIKTFLQLSLVRKVEATAKALVDSSKKQYHLIGYDMSMLGRIIISTCNQLSAPNGRIQNGAANYLLCGYSEVADLFLWDNYSKKAYQERGYEGNAFVVGNLILQKIANEKPAHPILEKYLKNGISKNALVAFSGPGHNTTQKGHIESTTGLLKLVKYNLEVKFFIKLHPKDSADYYKDLRSYNNVIFVDEIFEKGQVPNAIEFLKICGTLVTGASSVALDALLMGVNVICIDPLKELTHFDFIYQNDRVIKALEYSYELNIPEIAGQSNINQSDNYSALPSIINHIKSHLL